MSNQLFPFECYSLKGGQSLYKLGIAIARSQYPVMDSKKSATSYAVIFATVVLLQEIIHIQAQVTFSRDWNAGKRSVSECSQMSIKSAAAICQMLLGELKSLATCEMRSLLTTRGSEEIDNSPDIFATTHRG